MPSRARKPAKTSAKPGRQPRTAPYRRAQRDRGADTRAQLVQAGLEAFGRLGYEGASTRDIAKAAGANLAAIVYHFGGKEGLQLAVAEHIAGAIGARLGPTLALVAHSDATATSKSARAALHRLVEAFADVMLGSAEAEGWARFIVREQMQPTAAFDVIYRFLGGALANASRLMAAALDRDDDLAVRVRVFTMMGQVLIFRVAQAVILRRLGWESIGDYERALIKQTVLRQLDQILDAEQRK